MVRTSLRNLVNLRTRDIHWWGNGRKPPIEARPCNANKLLRKERDELEDRKFKSHDSEAAISNLVANLISTDSNKLLDSIRSLEKLYTQKYDPQTSRKLVKEQMKLFQGASAIEPNVRRAVSEALSKWESA